MRPRVPAPDQSLLPTMLLAFAVVCALLVGAAIIDRLRLRRRLVAEEEKPVDLLETLREARDAGDLDDAEVRRAREAIEKKAAEAPPSEPHVPRF